MHMDRNKLDEESLSSLNFTSLFKTRTDQLYLINVLKSLVYVFGLIMFLPVAMNIKATDGSEGFPEFIIITLVFLMIRSLLSFLSLLARVSRNYEAAFSLSKLLSKGSLVTQSKVTKLYLCIFKYLFIFINNFFNVTSTVFL